MYQSLVKKIHHWTIPYEGNEFKPHAVRHKSLAAYSALLVGVKVFVLLALIFTYPSQAEFSTITVNWIIELTNQERQAQGLSPLKHNSTLDLAAQKKASDMLANNYFAHTSPTGVKPWQWFKEVGYNYTFAGENLAMNFAEAEDAIQAWMDSASHRDNLLSKNYDEIGVAVVIGKLAGNETTLVVQLFGKTFTQVAGETFVPTSAPVEGQQVAGPISLVGEAAKQEVKLEKKEQTGWLAKIIQYSEKFFFVLLAFLILNLILTIIVRVEIQHKPIILHCLLVILLALTMIFLDGHFLEHIIIGTVSVV